jgi:hypothetical protein
MARMRVVRRTRRSKDLELQERRDESLYMYDETRPWCEEKWPLLCLRARQHLSLSFSFGVAFRLKQNSRPLLWRTLLMYIDIVLRIAVAYMDGALPFV